MDYWATGWTTAVEFLAGAMMGFFFFFFHHHLQAGSGAHPASYSVGTGSSYSGGKVAGA
jgi:hypothetical protein